MSDWRLRGQEDWLAGKTLYKIVFPDFWEKAYRERNAFFRMIESGARSFVEQTGRGQEFLEGERVQHFWHEHCDFCWEDAETDKAGTFYFTDDLRHCVCEECFRDFCERFKWKVLDGETYVVRLTEEEEKK